MSTMDKAEIRDSVSKNKERKKEEEEKKKC